MFDEKEAMQALAEIVDELDAAEDEAIDDLCGRIGAGRLERVLRKNETELWDVIESLARSNPRFRRALSSVWAYGSPMFDRREALLAELGESRSLRIEATLYSRTLADPQRNLLWRGISFSPRIDFQELAILLRSMADWAERKAGENPQS